MFATPMIIFDNVVFDLQKSGGISVVWYELIKRILENSSSGIAFVDNCNTINKYRKDLNIAGSTISGRDTLIPISRYMPVRIKADEPFIFHSSYYRYCKSSYAKNITTVHDFTYEYFRKGLKKKIHCWQKYNAIRHSDYVVCISENTKKDLLKFLPEVDESKIRVIYNGVSEDYYVIDCGAERANLPFAKGSYLVFVGNRVDEYKNFSLLKRCIASSEYNLVIVGSKLSEEEKIDLEKYLPENRYKCMGFLPNAELNVIYNNAAALVYPSSYEGFGIPIVEAQRAGCPVIAYNASSIPEVIGDTPLLMNELTDEELLKKIELLSDEKLMKEVRSAGLENSKRFSWDIMYQNYLELYKEALG